VKNACHYIDHDYAYTDPETGVLRNRENINDASVHDKNNINQIFSQLLHPVRDKIWVEK